MRAAQWSCKMTCESTSGQGQPLSSAAWPALTILPQDLPTGQRIEASNAGQRFRTLSRSITGLPLRFRSMSAHSSTVTYEHENGSGYLHASPRLRRKSPLAGSRLG